MIENQLHGLIIPSQEAGFNKALWIGLALLCCLLALAIYRWQKARKMPLNIAKRKLNDLMQSLPQSPEKAQTTALALTAILCEGFSVKRLDQIHPSNKKDWELFQKDLNTACYAKNSQSDINIPSLFSKAQQWLATQ
jgi:hypothetical protein